MSQLLMFHSVSEKVPANFTNMLFKALKITLEHASHPESETVQSLCTALQTQMQIGFYNMVVGVLSTDWTSAFEQLDVKHPQTVKTQLLTMIWDRLCEPI